MNDHTNNQRHDSNDDARRDAAMDTNLRRIAPGVKMPTEASEARVDAWMNAGAPAVAGVIAAPRKVQARRRVFAYSSAAALLIAAGAIAVISATSQRVQASTILKSLRQNTFSGIRATLSNIGAEGVVISGEVRLRFEREVSAEEVFDPKDGANHPKPLELFASVDVNSDGTGGTPKMKVQTEVALSPDADWAFVRTDLGAIEGIPDDPFVKSMLGATTQGVLIEMGKDTLRSGLFDMLVNEGEAAAGAGGALVITNDNAAANGLDLKTGPAKFRLEHGQVPFLVRGRDLPPEFVNRIAAKTRLGDLVDLSKSLGGEAGTLIVALTPEEVPQNLRAFLDAEGADRLLSKLTDDKRAEVEAKIIVNLGDGQATVKGGVQVDGASGKLMSMLGPVLSGKADSKALESIVHVIQGEGGDSQVRDLGNGQYLLVCSPAPEAGAEKLTINIAYSTGVGVESIEFAGIGDDAKGSIRIETFSGPIPAEFMSKARHDKPGVMKINEGMFNMFKGMAFPGGAGAKPAGGN